MASTGMAQTSILDLAVATPELSTLVTLVTKAGLAAVLKGSYFFTSSVLFLFEGMFLNKKPKGSHCNVAPCAARENAAPNRVRAGACCQLRRARTHGASRRGCWCCACCVSGRDEKRGHVRQALGPHQRISATHLASDRRMQAKSSYLIVPRATMSPLLFILLPCRQTFVYGAGANQRRVCQARTGNRGRPCRLPRPPQRQVAHVEHRIAPHPALVRTDCMHADLILLPAHAGDKTRTSPAHSPPHTNPSTPTLQA